MTKEEAIRILASSCIPGSKQTEALETLIPELAESEDERILASIADCVGLIGEDGNVFSNHNVTKVQVLAYLEKQKEQKPWKVGANAYFTPEQKPAENGVDVIKTSALLAADRLASAEMTGRLKERSEILDNPTKYGLQKPAEWSEEDEERVKQLIYDTEAIRAGYEKRKESLGDDFNDELIKDCDEQIKWLKSLRPSWKPSEEQMKALERASTNEYLSAKQFDILVSLYEQLKKL